MGYLPGESDIFAWAEQQKNSCCFLVGTQVTNTPEPGFYVGELSIGAKGYEFRSIKLTQNTTGKTWVTVYMTLGDEWVWTDWIPYATATPPQVYDLPLAGGYSLGADGAGYSKTQEGIVSVYFSVYGAFAASSSDIGGGAFATLPEGFRPSGNIPVPVVQQDIPGPDWVKVIVNPDGSMRYFGNRSTTAIYGSVSFAAST